MAERAVESPRRHKLLSWPVDLFTKESLLRFLGERVVTSRRTVVANLNLHALYCLERSPSMAALFRRQGTFVHIDGMPIVWLLRLRGISANAGHRLTYLDWATEALAAAAANGWKVGYIGSRPEICKAGIAYFLARYPGLTMKGWDGYFDMDDQAPGGKLERTLREVGAFEPDLLIVGMGMPRQEEFIERYSQRLSYKVAICSGAFVEYFTGGQPMPPRLVGRLGFEWLYRLACDPRRYARRYLVEPFMLVYLIATRRVG